MHVTNHARFNVHIAGQRDQPGSDRHPGQLLGGADRHQQHGGQGRPRGAQPEAQQAVPVQHLPRPLRPHHGRQQLLPARGGRPGGGGVPWPRRGRGDQLHLRAAVRQLGVRPILRPVPVRELLRSHEVLLNIVILQSRWETSK